MSHPIEIRKMELVDLLTKFGNVKIKRSRGHQYGRWGCVYYGPGSTERDAFTSRLFSSVSRLEARTLVAEVQNELRQQ